MMDIRKFLSKKSQLGEVEVKIVTVDKQVEVKNTPLDQKSTKSTGIATDLAQLGQPIKQIILNSYPRTKNRAFISNWYRRFKWLQYSVSLDSAFCYPCQQFLPRGSGQLSYTDDGFKNWKNALDVKCGFPKHEKSSLHIQAMAMWEEKKQRTTKGSSVESLVNCVTLEKHRYYVKSIIEVIQFLAINELALRGNYEVEEERERGLFKNLFEFTLKKDEVLRNAHLHIPQNAKYQSPDIQNDIIKSLAETVRDDIIKDVMEADVPWFTLMEDGTRDKNNRENIAIAVRYVKDGKPKESLLMINSSEKLDAATFTELTLNSLNDNKIDLTRLLSQCYDGASVMSGKISGVAARIEKKLNRSIPYVHCFNHRLHLVIMRGISEMPFIRQFFDQCSMLHEFFRHAKIAAKYQGKVICRLLEHRWSGHMDITKIVHENFSSILKTLNEIRHGNFSGEDVAKSIGIEIVMHSEDFKMALLISKKILSLLKPAEKALQGRSTSLKDALKIIKCVEQELLSLRSDDAFKTISEEVKSLPKRESDSATTFKRPIKRKRMEDFLIYDSLSPHRKNSSEKEAQEPFKAQYFEVLDIILSEMKRRFSDNEDLLDSISSLEELDCKKMAPLHNLGITIPSKEEISVVRNYLSNNDIKNEHIFEALYKQREAFKDSYELFASVATFGCSTAVCESTFSTLSSINRPQRMSMSHNRMSDLIFLAFERKRTENVNIATVMQKFNNMANRRLQLY